MQLGELYTFIDALPYVDRSIWESTRLISYFVATKLCTKKLKVSDIYKLPWDSEDEGEVINMEEYMKHIKQLENKLNHKNEK